MGSKRFKPGDDVIWQEKGRMLRRQGVFVRMIRLPLFYRAANQRGMGHPRWCYVQFKRNKHPSRVMLSELTAGNLFDKKPS